MHGKITALVSALLLSAGALLAQQPATKPADSTNSMNKPTEGKMNSSNANMKDINTASRSELAAAGWGQYADAIIAKRPYKSMNDLVEMKVVPQTAYDKGYEKFQIGNGNASPMADQKPMADPKLSPTTPSTNPVTPPTSGPVTATPGAAGTYPNTPAAPSPSGTASPTH